MRFALSFLTAFAIWSCGRPDATAAPKAAQGQLDLRNHNFATGGPVQLEGEWEFHWQKFLPDIKPTEVPAYKHPGAWNDFVHEGTPIGGPGYGTYRLRLLLPESTPELSLRTSDLRSAARIHVGSRTHPLGEPGRDRPATRPFSRPEATPLPPGENELILSIEIANFHHNTGGMIQSPVLSLRDQSDQSRIAQSVWQGTLAGFFFLFGLYHFILFFNRKENTVLWFGAYCVLISIRTMLTGEQIVYLLWRDLDFRLDMAFTYVNLHLLVACGALLIHAMFPEDFKLWIRNGYVAFCLSYTLTVLFLPSEQYSRLLIGFQIPMLVFIVYALITIIQATWRGRPSAGLFLFGFGFLAAGAIADILISIFYGYSTPYTAMGLVAAVFAQSVVISQRFSAAFRQVEALYAEALQLRDQVLQSEKLSTIGTMAAGIVHDLKNPVAVIKGYLEMADSDSIGRETRRKFLSTVDQEANRMLALVQDLLDYSQGSVEIQRTWLEAHEYADQVQRALSPLFQARGVAFILQLDYRGPLQIDPDRFLRVLINIADNAAAVLEPNQKFTLRVMGAPQKVVFELEDNGPGIPVEIQDRLFDPFVTQGKKHGTGLGLAIARSIVEAHGGSITFKSSSAGTVFRIGLPGAL